MREFKWEYHRCDNSVELYSKDQQKLTCTSAPTTDGEFMSVDDPAVLAAFVAFCSNKEHKVFLRGCTKYYERSVPSLFRIDSCKECDEPTRGRRWSTYKDLLEKLKSNLQGDRWNSGELGAILQHYGIRTPRLDVVHDLHTAIWFANHEFETCGSCRVAVQSKQKYGWISVYMRSKDQERPIIKAPKASRATGHVARVAARRCSSSESRAGFQETSGCPGPFP